MKSEYANLNALAVRLYGRQIGIITKLAGERQLFSFEQDYIEDPERPTLSLSFQSTTGGVVTSTRPVSGCVPPFFSNLLPEGRLREYLAKLADVNSERESFLLAVLGADLPGLWSLSPRTQSNTQTKSRNQVVRFTPQKKRCGFLWPACN